MKIVFPEGSKNIKLDIPFGVDKQYEAKTFGYLDFWGRPTIVIEKANVFDYHAQQFSATYEFEKNDLLIEPLYLFAFFIGLFAFFIFIGRVDLGLEEKSHSE